MKNQIEHVTPSCLIKFYYDLLPKRQMQEVRVHLAECETCLKEFEQVQKGIEKLASKTVSTPSETADTRIINALHLQKERTPSFFEHFRIPVFAGSFAVILFIIIASIFLFPARQNVGQLAFNGKTASIKSGEMIAVPEGVNAVLEQEGAYKVHFSAGSSFAASKKNDKFIIALQNGQGDFSVVKRGRKFKVNTFNAVVRVTGTVFSVKADESSSLTTVSVTEGRVEVTGKTGALIVLHNGETCEIIKNNVPTRVSTLNRTETGLKSRQQTFDNAKEKIYLRDGSVLVGHTIKQTESETIFETSSGRITVYPQDIERTEFIR